jgi:hypothetical protein
MVARVQDQKKRNATAFLQKIMLFPTQSDHPQVKKRERRGTAGSASQQTAKSPLFILPITNVHLSTSRT